MRLRRLPEEGHGCLRRLHDAADRGLLSFTLWFCSRGGVWQTALLVVTIAIAELVDPSLDPHGFWLLWALTVYSAITQPALAFAGALSAAKLEEAVGRIAALEEAVEALEERNGAMLAAIAEALGVQLPSVSSSP